MDGNGPTGDGITRNRRGLHFGLYFGVIGVLGVIAASASWIWFFAATMASDGCHGDDARDICTVGGQHWAVMLPLIAIGSAAVAAAAPAVAVAAFGWRAGWVWIGLPLTVAAYVAGPFLADWARGVLR